MDSFAFSHGGTTHDVYRSGSGPAVIVIHEMPGLHEGVLRFGERVVDAGFTAYLPSLFGRVGGPFAMGPMMWQSLRACVSREFVMFADRTGPVVSWLRALAVRAHEECGGPGVGAVGMCFTGGFALAMAVDQTMLAPVLAEPSLPVGLTARHRAALGLDAADLERVKQRTREDGLCVLGLRFSQDKLSPPERFTRLRQELGDAFRAVEIDSSPGNACGIGEKAHSVLTEDLVDEPGHPTREALDRVLALFTERLQH